jgi:hypothetical protein
LVLINKKTPDLYAMQKWIMPKISNQTSQKLNRLVKNEHFLAIYMQTGFLIKLIY